MLIDEINNMIRDSCQQQDIERLVSQYQIEEARGRNMLKKEDSIIDSNTKVVMPGDIKVDLNMMGSDDFAPIHAACSVGNIEIVNFLVFKKKCDPNLKSLTDEWTPLEISSWNAHPRIVDLLLKDTRTQLNVNHPVRGSCLHLAAKNDQF